MKLDVIAEKQPWYASGLQFTCTQCGNCCTGGPGYVWISDTEIGRLAKHLKMSSAAVIAKYCRRIGKKYSLKENRTPEGNYEAVAEHTFALMLALARRIVSIDRDARQGRWLKTSLTPLRGQTLGIVGLGRIGGRRAEIYGHDLTASRRLQHV